MKKTKQQRDKKDKRQQISNLLDIHKLSQSNIYQTDKELYKLAQIQRLNNFLDLYISEGNYAFYFVFHSSGFNLSEEIKEEINELAHKYIMKQVKKGRIKYEKRMP